MGGKILKDKKDLIDNLLREDEVVLDVGFWGQGINVNDANWTHGLLKRRVKAVYGIDIEYDESKLSDKFYYKKLSAENFDFENKFNVIFAADIIEHLSNPGMFLDSCSRNLKNGGRLIITTPNCFNIFNIAGKFSREEPVVNRDHTCYFNKRTLETLLDKNNWEIKNLYYLFDLGIGHKQSIKKRILNFVYKLFSYFTPKYSETLVVEAKKR